MKLAAIACIKIASNNVSVKITVYRKRTAFIKNFRGEEREERRDLRLVPRTMGSGGHSSNCPSCRGARDY